MSRAVLKSQPIALTKLSSAEEQPAQGSKSKEKMPVNHWVLRSFAANIFPLLTNTEISDIGAKIRSYKHPKRKKKRVV